MEKATELLGSIRVVLIEVVPRFKNTNANTLAKLASTRDAEFLDVVSVEFLAESNIKQWPKVMELDHEPSWMDHIVTYLKNRKLPENKTEARVLRLKAARYIIYDDKLYRIGYSMPLLREIHKDIYGNHAEGQSLAFKTLRQGYYWPTMKANCMEFARKYDKCQWFAPIDRTSSSFE